MQPTGAIGQKHGLFKLWWWQIIPPFGRINSKAFQASHWSKKVTLYPTLANTWRHIFCMYRFSNCHSMLLRFSDFIGVWSPTIFSELCCHRCPRPCALLQCKSFWCRPHGSPHNSRNTPFVMPHIRIIVWIERTYGQDVWSNCLQELVGISTNQKEAPVAMPRIFLGIHVCSRLSFRWWALDF